MKFRDGMGNVATVTIADVRQSNGVIHVNDTVLLPMMQGSPIGRHSTEPPAASLARRFSAALIDF